MAVNKVIVDDEILIDLTQDTVTPEDVRDGIIFHTSDGKLATGTCYMVKDNIGESLNYNFKNKGLTNKIVYMGDILLDLSDDTITPYDVKEGKIFHMRNGESCIGAYIQPLNMPIFITPCQDNMVALMKNVESFIVINDNTTSLKVNFKKVTNDSSVIFRYKIHNKNNERFRKGQKITMTCSMFSDISNSQTIAHANTNVCISAYQLNDPSSKHNTYNIFDYESSVSVNKNIVFTLEEESLILTLDFNVNFVNNENFYIQIDDITVNDELIKFEITEPYWAIGHFCFNFPESIFTQALLHSRSYTQEGYYPYYLMISKKKSKEEGVLVVLSKEPCVVVKNTNNSIQHTYTIQHNETNIYFEAMSSLSFVSGGLDHFVGYNNSEEGLPYFSTFDDILCSNYDILYDNNIVTFSNALDTDFYTMTFSEHLYDKMGNVVELKNSSIQSKIFSQNESSYVAVRVQGEFINPKIELNFSFGESDIIEGYNENVYEHKNLTWWIKSSEIDELYDFDNQNKYDGECISSGINYKTEIAYDIPFSIDYSDIPTMKDKTYHTIYFVLESKGSDSSGVSKSWLSNIRINGEPIKGGIRMNTGEW